MSEEQPTIVVPSLCNDHRHKMLVHDLQIPPTGPWQVAELTATILLFQAAAQDERISRRAENEASNLSLILAEVGCLACFEPKWYDLMVALLKKGVSRAAKVAQFKERDPDWPYGRPPDSPLT